MASDSQVAGHAAMRPATEARRQLCGLRLISGVCLVHPFGLQPPGLKHEHAGLQRLRRAYYEHDMGGVSSLLKLLAAAVINAGDPLPMTPARRDARCCRRTGS